MSIFYRTSCVGSAGSSGSDGRGGPVDPEDEVFVSYVVYRGETFGFRGKRHGSIYRIKLIQRPEPTDPKRRMDGGCLNLINDSLIWLADAAAPETEAAAKTFCRSYAKAAYAWIFHGKRFWLPRDPE